MRSLAVIAVGLALGIGSAVVLIARSEAGGEERRTTSEENRRVLTAEQTQRLVRYASALHGCLARRGVDVSPPKKGSRAITMKAARAVGIKRLVALTTTCTAPLGDPPKPSSLQAVDARTIVLSVPKRCLLDPKVEA